MKRWLIVVLAAALMLPLIAQDKPQDPPKPPAQAAQVKPDAPAAKPQESEPKPYDKVVTPDFKTQAGLFKAHTSKGKLLLEIPKAELGRDFLLVVQIKGSPSSASYPGQSVDDMVVRWELRENKVLLRAVSYANIADPNDPIKKGVEAMNTATVMMAFNVEALAADGSPVFDATKLFTSDVNEIPVKKRVGGMSLDAARTFLEKVRVYPINLNVEALQTFNPKPATLPAGIPPQYADMLPSPPSPTALVHYSFVKLPEKPMMGRLYDNRAPFFTHSHTDYSRPDHETRVRQFIARWRLEKKNPAAAKSEPVKPIVFYIDPATPKKWVPYVKMGVEAWQPAFEQAGFLKAIVAKEAPTPQEDPDWSADDARYSVIRWVPSTTANAMGPHVSDPRSGEILEADVEIYHNVQQLARDWYWVQSGPLDPKAKTLPLPDETMGEILLYIITHEVGHSLGLPHNFKASALYTIEQIRDKNWVKKNSHVPTLMDYARFNYVAQPEDGIDPKDLIPKIGPYDNFIIHWGYTPIPAAKTPDQEKPTLNEWTQVQDKTPYLRFSTAGTRGTDPGEETEAVGDIDAVKATTLGFKNLRRATAMLPKAVLKPGEDYEQFEHMYGAIWDQARLETGHVANIIGGYDSEPKAGTAEGVRFAPIGKDRQKQAIAFLNDNIFKTPDWLLPADVLRKIEPTSGQARVLSLQQAALGSILSSARLLRLQEHQAILGDQAYTTAQMLADLRGSIFSELVSAAKVDPYRRNLQRTYIDMLIAKLNPPSAPAGAQASVAAIKDDSRGAIRAELKGILGLLSVGAADEFTRTHLADLKDQITQALEPRK